jgi:hypothetical protein
VQIRVEGSGVAYFFRHSFQRSIEGNNIKIDVNVWNDDPEPHEFPWSVDDELGPLSVGIYEIDVSLWVDGTFKCEYRERLTIVPPTTFGWTGSIPITASAAPNALPVQVVYDRLLHLFWDAAWDPVDTSSQVTHAVYDQNALSSPVQLAKCFGASRVAAIGYAGALRIFYSAGDYPNVRLFEQVYDGQRWSAGQQLTQGDGYDGWGAAATVFANKLWLFWKRQRQDTTRAIYCRTLSGTSWDDEFLLFGDDYQNEPPLPVEYRNELFLFTAGGTRYRRFNGLDWTEPQLTSAVPVKMDTDGSVPGAIIVGDELVLFQASDDGHIYALSYDGNSWSLPLRITRGIEHNYPITNLSVTRYHDSLYLAGGGPSWPGTTVTMMVCPLNIRPELTAVAPRNDGEVSLLWSDGFPRSYTLEQFRNGTWSPVPPASQWPIRSRSYTTHLPSVIDGALYRVMTK